MKRTLHALTIIAAWTGIFYCSCGKEGIPQSTLLATNKSVATEYLIRQGEHYCVQNHAEMMTNPEIHATVTFDSTAIYTTQLAENQGDVNKLIGFSDGGSNHQENSARLGWSWNGKKIILYAYAYSNKARIIKTLGSVDVNQSFPCSVKAENNYYYFRVNNHADSVERVCSSYTGYHYRLYPYFGGDEAAPHDVRIVIVEEPVNQAVK